MRCYFRVVAAAMRAMRSPMPVKITAATDGNNTPPIISSDASIIGSNRAMCTQVMSVGVRTCGFCGMSKTVAGTSVIESAPTSKPLARSVGQAIGKMIHSVVRSVAAAVDGGHFAKLPPGSRPRAPAGGDREPAKPPDIRDHRHDPIVVRPGESRAIEDSDQADREELPADQETRTRDRK